MKKRGISLPSKTFDIERSAGLGSAVNISSRWILSGGLALLALVVFFLFYEKFPRQGWVDASIYSGYVLNPKLYRVYSFSDNAYQGSRFGYLLPLMMFGSVLGDLLGRYAFVTALYILYVVAILVVARCFDERKHAAIALSAPLLLLPQSVAEITYGGSAGAAMVFQLCAIAAILFPKIEGSDKWTELCSAVAGACWAMAISAHIFAAFPISIFIFYLFWVSDLKFRRRPGLLGFAALVLLIQGFAAWLGVHRFYLSYSFPWIKKSLHGSGADFIAHSASLFDRTFLWVPFFLYGLLSVILVVWRLILKKEVRAEFLFSAFALVGVPLCFFFFDYVIGGNILAVPAYQSLVMPVLIFFALCVAFFAIQRPIEGVVNRCLISLGFLVVLSLPFFQLVSPMFAPALKANHANSEKFYESQIEFMKTMKYYRLNERYIGFVFRAQDPADANPNTYADSHLGNERRFDYIDSLASLFLWDKSIYGRLAENGASMMTDDPDQFQQIIVLGRGRDELARLSKDFCRHKVSSLPVAPVCGGLSEFSWCWMPVEKC